MQEKNEENNGIRDIEESHKWDLHDPLKRQKIKRGGAVGGLGASIGLFLYMALLKLGLLPEDPYIRGVILTVFTWVGGVIVNVCRKARQHWPALKIFEVGNNNNHNG